MKIKILIALLFCLVLTGLVNAAEKVEFTQMPAEKALAYAKKEKKLLLLCIHSIFATDIPTGIEEVLNKSFRQYALKTAVFVKVLCGVPDSSGTHTKLSKEVSAFLKKYQLPTTYTGPLTLMLDQYGNILGQLENAEWIQYRRQYAKYKTKKVIDFFKKMTKQAQKIEKDFKASYKKANQRFKRGKPLAGVKELKEIIDTGWQGYEIFEQSKQDLKNMRIMTNEAKKAIDDFLVGLEDLDEDESGKKKSALIEKAVDLLNFICQTYKSTAFCQEIKNAVTLLEEGKFDELEKELDVLSDVLDALPEIADKPKEDKETEESTKKE